MNPRKEWSPSPSFRKSQVVEKPSVAQAGRPSVPSFLDAAEKQRMRQMMRQLEERRQLVRTDGELLVQYVTTYSTWRRAVDALRTEGEVVTVISRGKNDEQIERFKPNPWLAIKERCTKQLVAILDRLGWSPLNREKIKPVEKDPNAKVPPEEGTVAWILEQMDQQAKGENNAN